MSSRPPVTRGRPPVTKGPSRAPTIVAVVSVLLVAVVVIGGVLYFRSRPSGPLQTGPVAATYGTTVQNGVIVAGTGPRVIDVYEDALCPACRQFETTYSERITAALNAGRVTVRYHMVNLLEDSSSPPGYSTAGGAALICAAENNAFPSLHQALYAQQPAEGGPGFTPDQLVDAGRQAGAAPGYEPCVRSTKYAAAVGANYRQAAGSPALLQTVQGRTGFATPTVVLDGRRVDSTAPELQAALA